jgi:hypothetical protein
MNSGPACAVPKGNSPKTGDDVARDLRHVNGSTGSLVTALVAWHINKGFGCTSCVKIYRASAGLGVYLEPASADEDYQP